MQPSQCWTHPIQRLLDGQTGVSSQVVPKTPMIKHQLAGIQTLNSQMFRVQPMIYVKLSVNHSHPRATQYHRLKGIELKNVCFNALLKTIHVICCLYLTLACWQSTIETTYLDCFYVGVGGLEICYYVQIAVQKLRLCSKVKCHSIMANVAENILQKKYLKRV